MKRLLLVLLLLCAGILPAAANNPFQSGRPAEPSGLSLPGPLAGMVGDIVAMQRRFHQALTGEVTAIKQGGGFAAVLTLIGIAFLYGVFHAAGPGHGKAVVISYFLAAEAPLRRGLLAGGMVALGHTASAALIVLGLGLVLGYTQMGLLDEARWVELASYLAITGIGLWMLWGHLTGRAQACCDHDHGHPAHAHHDHAHHDHDHGKAPDRGAFAGLTGLFTSVGLVPCTGAMILLLFTLANGLLLVGLLATLAIGVGMAMTLTALGLVAILLRRGLAGGGDRPWLQRGLGIAGSLTVTLVGAAMLIGVLDRLA